MEPSFRRISRNNKLLAQWLEQDYAHALDEDGEEMLELLVGRVKRMYNLIEGILEYSKVGYIARKSEGIDIHKTIKEIIDSIAPPDNIEIIIENELPVITCDKTQIVQLFQNR